ncbi:MAG: HPF/RaiA family ribosome-associated protein [Verrucomicrobiales bacterium]|nr:HPF/RaiA family ribosome-associated protein [Verrucomicrobiales bacterium]
MNSHQKTERGTTEMRTPMGVDIRILGMRPDNELRDRLESDLRALGLLLPIEHARVSLERQHEATPPFQVVAMLVVPGPDIHAAARDHTWHAAWRKVLERLREQIEQRRDRQARRKTNEPRRRPPPTRASKKDITRS